MEQEQFKREILPLRERLIFYAERLLGDKHETEDVVQEVFLKLWYMRNELSRYNSVAALSMTITKHLCINRLKIANRERDKPDDAVFADENLAPDRQLEQKDSVALVMKIIDSLPGLQQTVLKMKHIDGFETEEIAELTGCTPEAIRMNLSRARKKVKDLFLKNNRL